MLVKERIYGKNQTVEAVDQNTSILSVEMQNKEDILVFVLGFGANCEVLEPEWLREELFSTTQEISKKY
jgi:predicted DNA-binding transcriptional regulator YafY